MSKRLVLIDSHAILHRAYHALPEKNFTYNGQYVNAVYGFFSMFLSALDELKPDYLLACFDAPGPTFRHEKFIGYQANRLKMDTSLADQIKLTREILEEAKFPLLSRSGYEADDLIGTVLKQVKQENSLGFSEQIVITGDKDLMQLVDETTSLFFLHRGITNSYLVDINGVKEKLGVRPDQVVDYKGLAGDSSDNYPGVYGIGPKTAQVLLEKYDNLDTIYNNLDNIKENWRKKLEKDQESAYLSCELAQIVKDAPISVPWPEAKWTDEKLLALKKGLQSLNFRSLVGRIEERFNKGTSEKQTSFGF